MLAKASEGMSCNEWASATGNPFATGVDMGELEQAVHTLEEAELGLFVGYCGKLKSNHAHCAMSDHASLCTEVTQVQAAIQPSGKCAEQLDVHVATELCESQKGSAKQKPKAAVVALCTAETKDVAAVKTMCDNLGVVVTTKTICQNVGYGVGICGDAAAIANKSLTEAAQKHGLTDPCMVVNAGTLGLICGNLQQMEGAANCTVWGKTDGLTILHGTRIMNELRPHVKDGVSAFEYCQANGGPVGANVAACMSVTDAAMLAACQEDGASEAVRLACVKLRYPADACATAAATAEGVYGIQGPADTLPVILPAAGEYVARTIKLSGGVAAKARLSTVLAIVIVECCVVAQGARTRRLSLWSVR